MATGKEIRLEVGRELNTVLGKRTVWEVVNTVIGATSLTDAVNLASSFHTPQQFMQWWARESDASAAAPDGDKVRAGQLTPATGVLAVSPSFTANLANGDTLELWDHQGPDPDDIDMARDRALTQKCWRWRLSPLSWALNSDFLLGSASVVTNWQNVNATLSRVAKSGLERFSEYTMRVANSALSGYAYQTINCREKESWIFFVIVQADVGTAEVAVRDYTGGVDITLDAYDDRETWAGESFQIISGTFETPDNCEQISVRLGGQEANADTYWALLAIYPQDAKNFVLPSRITGAGLVGRFVRLTGYDWPEQEVETLGTQPDLVQVGGGYVSAQFSYAPGSDVLFFQELAHYAALQTIYNTGAGRRTGDAASTDCPLELIKWATLDQLMRGQFAAEFALAEAIYGPPLLSRLVEAAPGRARA